MSIFHVRLGAAATLTIWLVVFFKVCAFPVWASSSVVLDGSEKYDISGHLEVFEDKEKVLTIEEVSSEGYAPRFRAGKDPVPNLGITDSVVWARFSIENPGREQRKLLLSYNAPLTDSVSLFVPLEESGFNRLDAGDSVEPSAEVVPHRYYVFPLIVPAQERITYYMRVESPQSLMTLDLSLWRPSAFGEKDRQDQMLYGILFGILISFIFYFSVLSVKLRNPVSLYFVLYVACLGVLLAGYKGYIHQFTGTEYRVWNNILVLVFIGLLYFTGAKFLRAFLNIRMYSKGIDNIVMGLQWMGIFFIPMNIWDNPFTPVYGLVLIGLGPIFSSTVSVLFWIKGVPNAKYFALGWLAGHLVSVLDILRVFAVLPHSKMIDYILPFALFSSLAFFTMAIFEQTRRYRLLANRDQLTGLPNRRYFEEVLQKEWNRNMRYSRPLSVILIDVDSFKAFNDNYGHNMGDECLRAIAEILGNYARRPGDLAARYGGEEFIVLVPDTEAGEAQILAEDIRAGVEALGIPHRFSGKSPVVTVSSGVASAVPQRGIDPFDLVGVADEALYKAKRQGRNRVVAFIDRGGYFHYTARRTE